MLIHCLKIKKTIYNSTRYCKSRLNTGWVVLTYLNAAILWLPFCLGTTAWSFRMFFLFFFLWKEAARGLLYLSIRVLSGGTGLPDWQTHPQLFPSTLWRESGFICSILKHFQAHTSTLAQALVEVVGMSLCSIISLVVVWQGSCTMNVTRHQWEPN